MSNRVPSDWKLLANIGVVVLLVIYYLYSRDISAALAITVGMVIYSVGWLVKSLRNNRRVRKFGNDNATPMNPKKDVEAD